MDKKYEFTGETTDDGRLRRIRRCVDGEIGGFLQSEYNLSHEGACWVSGNARVYGSARVSGNAQISGNAQVFGDAHVYGSAIVNKNAQVSGIACIRESVFITNDTVIASYNDYVFMILHGYYCTFTRDYVYVGWLFLTSDNILENAWRLTKVPSEHREQFARSVVAFHRAWRQSNGWE